MKIAPTCQVGACRAFLGAVIKALRGIALRRRLTVNGAPVAPLTPAEESERPRFRGDCETCETCQADRDLLQRQFVATGTTMDFVAAKTALRDDPAEHAGPCRIERECGHDDAEMLRRSRPCIFVACSLNPYLDVTAAGKLKWNFPKREPWEMPPGESCALDVAEEGEHTLEEVGAKVGLVRERANQILKSTYGGLQPVMRALGIEPRSLGADFGSAEFACSATMV